MRRRLILLTVGLLVAASGAYGQAQRGSIAVRVTDAEGAAVPGASVTVTSEDTLTRRTVFTDSDGRATAVALDPATNYQVVVELEGFAISRAEQVVVRAGQETALDVELSLAEISEELTITAAAPLVDVTKTQAGQDITLQLTESLPTARSYQDYLQLVPGVQDALGSSDNPASRSGINYSDADVAAGDVGRSTDNLYYFDGINVTDRTAGTSGANLNTEIIQEQSVLTGAIPAEYVGAPGLISNVVTKSGGNQFSGSVNYYFQDDSLVESNDHFTDETFSAFDAAVTLGGPIVRDKAWFFGSFRRLEEERDVVNEQGTFLRTPSEEQDQAFGKVSWAITNRDIVTGAYLTDPLERDGNFNRSVPNSADSTFDFGGERWSVGYNRVWGPASIELAVTDHEADLNQFSKERSHRNVVSFAPGVPFSSGQEVLGSLGNDILVTRTNESQRGSVEYLFDTGWGDHAVKAGVVSSESELFEDTRTIGDPPAIFLSLSSGGPVRLCAILGTCTPQPWSTVDFGVSSDESQGFRENLTPGQMATLLGLWDDNGNGVLDEQEIIDNMVFASTDGNPNGLINYTRDLETAPGANLKGSESLHYFLQDSWQWRRWSVNAGIRAEDTTFIASTGEDVGTWDTEIAPRVSVSYDLRGDGRSSVGAFYGQYYDAFRDTAIDFAGTLTGRIIDEQVYVDALNDWVTFRVRGGASVQDAFFAPEIATPVTEEIQLQYKQDLGRSMMFEVNLIDRETSDIGEDYGSLYYNAAQYAALGGDPNDPTFFLGPEYFGFPNLAAIPTNLNFLIGTLPAETFRDYQGVELIFRKRYSNNWQLLGSYNWADADANSNSDANFDGQGDVIFLDPRAPNRTGIQPGLVEHLFKVFGSYNWDNGIQVGAGYRWNSGVILNRNQGQAFGRSLPARTDTPFPFGGWPGGTFEDDWIHPNAIGFIDGNEYGVLDLRLSYVLPFAGRFEADFFADVFNVLDDQQVVRVQDLEGGGAGFAFLEGMEFVNPRRYYLGARLRF
jgi:hypothetical protein